jgi:hypothetical protein
MWYRILPGMLSVVGKIVVRMIVLAPFNQMEVIQSRKKGKKERENNLQHLQLWGSYCKPFYKGY